MQLTVSPGGEIEALDDRKSPAEGTLIKDYALPGMPNLHSHAFQRVMAGRAEAAIKNKDDFWSWREIMYDYANRVTPEQLQAIAAQLYMEMLKSGYTSVAEFHYLHHAGRQGPGFPSTETADAIIAAAEETGIGLTLLPALYMTADFDEPEPAPRQVRFINDMESFFSLFERLRNKENDNIKTGIAFHSLRAVPARRLRETLKMLADERIDCPIHIHIAETLKEVETCTRLKRLSPVKWLFENIDIDHRWCLVHATHLTDWEVEKLAKSDCVAGLCPTTEANLGDGIFRFEEYINGNGKFGIGSDSHISVNPVEELRWLEYGQRLLSNRRNISATAGERRVGGFLWDNAVSGGAQALGQNIDGLRPGNRADLLALDGDHPLLYDMQAPDILDSFIFSGNDNLVKHVMVGGKWVIKDGAHIHEEEILARFKKTIRELHQ